jgi:hypothetical protein
MVLEKVNRVWEWKRNSGENVPKAPDKWHDRIGAGYTIC